MVQAIPIALMAAGSIVKGVAAHRAGKQNKKALYADAREQELAGNQQALAVRDQARREIGAQVAAQFANGFQGGSGSALDALAESQINATLDVLQTRRDALSKAASQRERGRQEMEQGRFGLASGLIGAASSVYGGVKDWAAANKGTTPSKAG